MVERHGEVWMVLFQLQADQGVSGAVQGSLAGLVHWDVTVLDDVNHLEEHVVGDGSEGVRWSHCLKGCWRLRYPRKVRRTWAKGLRELQVMERRTWRLKRTCEARRTWRLKRTCEAVVKPEVGFEVVKAPTNAFHNLWIPPTLIARRKKAFKKKKP